jgi:hypothetical protein
MARGFESKAVADQQESADERRRTQRKEGALEPERIARKRSLELARADVERRLATATAPAHRQMLERALQALVSDLAALD